jgi:hypothetical protein
MTLQIEAPNTFLMAISLDRRAAIKVARPSKPRKEIRMARPAKLVRIFPKRSSLMSSIFIMACFQLRDVDDPDSPEDVLGVIWCHYNKRTAVINYNFDFF